MRRYGTLPSWLETGSGSGVNLDISIPGVINVHGDTAPQQIGVLEQLTTWVKMNPLLTAGVCVGGYLLLRKR